MNMLGKFRIILSVHGNVFPSRPFPSVVPTSSRDEPSALPDQEPIHDVTRYDFGDHDAHVGAS